MSNGPGALSSILTQAFSKHRYRSLRLDRKALRYVGPWWRSGIMACFLHHLVTLIINVEASMKTLIRGLFAGLSLFATGSAQAALHERWGGMVYDDVLKITWLKDANYANTSDYVNPPDSFPFPGRHVAESNGLMHQDEALNWAAGLNYGGYTDWRLPTMVYPPPDGSGGCKFAYIGTDCGYNVRIISGSTVHSELAYMYYVNLGNKASFDAAGNPQSGAGLVDDPLNPNDESLFSNLQSDAYWTGVYDPTTGAIWGWWFSTADGLQALTGHGGPAYAWAVRDGDVPEPSTIVLAGLAMAGLAVIRRRRY